MTISLRLGGPLFTLFVILLVLKLVGVISVGWFWVFSPLLLGPALILGILLLVLFVAFLKAWSEGRALKRGW